MQPRYMVAVSDSLITYDDPAQAIANAVQIETHRPLVVYAVYPVAPVAWVDPRTTDDTPPGGTPVALRMAA